MFVSGDRRYKMFVVSFFCLKISKLIVRYHVKICFNVPTLFHTDACYSASYTNIFTILSALEALGYDLNF